MEQIRYKDSSTHKAIKEYVNVYSHKEHTLNKRLYEECSKADINFTMVEALLKQGTDPLGPTQGGKLNELDHVYGEIVSETDPDDGKYLPRLTEIFLKYGMDIDHPCVPGQVSDVKFKLSTHGAVSVEFEMINNKVTKLIVNGMSDEYKIELPNSITFYGNIVQKSNDIICCAVKFGAEEK